MIMKVRLKIYPYRIFTSNQQHINHDKMNEYLITKSRIKSKSNTMNLSLIFIDHGINQK